jgi:hypothetical protein
MLGAVAATKAQWIEAPNSTHRRHPSLGERYTIGDFSGTVLKRKGKKFMAELSLSEKLIEERFRYILRQKEKLNESTFKIASFYQVVFFGLIAGGGYLLEAAKSEKLDAYQVKSLGFLGAAFGVLVSIICILLITSGVLSWLKYRREEHEIELEVHGSTRPAPTGKDVLRWHETYVVIAMVAMTTFLIIGYLKLFR